MDLEQMANWLVKKIVKFKEMMPLFIQGDSMQIVEGDNGM